MSSLYELDLIQYDEINMLAKPDHTGDIPNQSSVCVKTIPREQNYSKNVRKLHYGIDWAQAAEP